MSTPTRLSRLEAAGALSGIALALWGIAQWSIPAAAVVGGLALASASLVRRSVSP